MGVQLPRWVWVGAGLLACVAGMVNVVGYLSFEQQAVTHLTGTTTLLGEAVAKRDLHAISRLAGVALAFMAGAALSGMIVQDSTLKLGRRYGVALVLESLLLFAAILTQLQILGIVHFIIIDAPHRHFNGTGCDIIYKFTVVADDNYRFGTIDQEIFQPLDGFNIKMVSGLIQQ